MLIRSTPPLHLTYCLNVHPGETLADVHASIATHALEVRRAVCPAKPFGLGLRLSRRAVNDLTAPAAVDALRASLAEQDLYAFTLNGFPYGTFHGQAVKTDVYRPDWTDPRRLDYTRDLADCLAGLLPEGMDGSISTVPLSYKAWPQDAASQSRLFDHLAALIAHLHRLRLRTGREIHLGLEPEPDCTLESTPETVVWFEGPLDREGAPRLATLLGCPRSEAAALLRRHLGVCLDTCHLAVQFEDLADSLATLVRHGIRISKVQLSAALECEPTTVARARLADFVDPVYLHQVKARPERPCVAGEPDRVPLPLKAAGGGPSQAFSDLPAALASDSPSTLWRVHFHVPLYFEGDAVLRSTAAALDARFWRALVTAPISHLEIETYTFHVLPPSLQSGGVARSIAREFEWVLPRLAKAAPRGT